MSLRSSRDNLLGNSNMQYINLLDNTDVHNEFLRLLFKNGIIGFSLFSIINYKILFKTYKYLNQLIFIGAYIGTVFMLNEYFIFIYSTVLLMQLIFETKEVFKSE